MRFFIQRIYPNSTFYKYHTSKPNSSQYVENLAMQTQNQFNGLISIPKTNIYYTTCILNA